MPADVAAASASGLSSVRRPAADRRSGVRAGSAYDGLIGVRAAAHDRTLRPLDRRAEVAYRRLAIDVPAIAA